MKRLTLMMGLCVLALVACGGGNTSDDSGVDASNTVINYLDAKVKGDEAGIRANICSAMEADIEREIYSFSGVNAQLEGASCDIDLEASKAVCSGSITAEYGADTREFPLTTYNIVKDDGVWKWCGEATANE